jgi:hypothetical protein
MKSVIKALRIFASEQEKNFFFAQLLISYKRRDLEAQKK